MLPDLDGFEVIRRMREGGVRTPVVFLTARDAHRRQDPRPDARRRRLRHQAVQPGGADRPHPGRAAPHQRGEPRHRPAHLRRPGAGRGDARGVAAAGQLVSLSPTEFKLLRYLMLNAGRVLSKAQILDHVWSYDFRGDDSIVESYISYLRRKVDIVEPRLIHTLRGVGYVLRLPS